MASITVSDLYINGTQMPAPKHQGVTISTEKVWSADTGRTASGKMVGTLIATKTKVKLEWPPLTMAEVALIEAAVSNANSPFVSMRYTDMTGQTVTKTVTETVTNTVTKVVEHTVHLAHPFPRIFDEKNQPHPRTRFAYP